MAVSAGPPGSSRGGTAGGPTVCAQCAEVLIKMPGCGHPPALRPLLSWSLGWLLEGPWSPEGELGPSCSSWAPCKARALRDVAQSRRHARSARHTAPATPGPGPQPSAGQRLRGARERPHFHVSTVFTLSQLCPQRGPRAAPRFADVTSVLFKARRSGAATALTERRPPTASPASCSCPRQPLLSPSPALVPSSLPFSGLPVCTLGKGGVAACGLCIWLHSAVASPVPGTIRGEQVPTLAVCSRRRGGRLRSRCHGGAAEDVHVGLSRDRSSVRPRQCAQVPTSVADTWCHVSAQPCACMRGAPPPFQGSGGHPQ